MVARLKRSGIVLVTTLLMTVLVVMIVTVVVYTGAGGLSLTGNFYEREAALLAADSGLQYAMTRLQEDANWRGDQPETAPEPRPDFAIVEQDGNVYGFLTTLYGHKSQFRIKFNYEDGDDGQDGLADSSDPQYLVPSPLVSINNLLGSSSVPAVRSNVDGRGVAADPPPYDVPRKTACIIVEGLAGWGVRDSGPENPSGFLSNRAVTRRVVEAYFGLDESDSADSAAYAAGSIDAVLDSGGVFSVSSKDDEYDPRVRSLENVSVSASSGTVSYDDGENGEVVVGERGSFTVGGTTPSDAKVSHENSSSLFKKITWDAIAKAEAGSTTDAKMKAGTYVWRMDDLGQPYLEYHAGKYDSADDVPDTGGTRIDSSNITSSGSGVAVDSKSLTVALSNNVYVSETTTNPASKVGLSILVDDAVTSAGLRPTVGFIPEEGSTRSPILTSEADVSLEGSVLGNGAVTSEGSITFQGPSVLEADPETGVSLYAQGDITVKAIPDQVADSRDSFVDSVEASLTATLDFQDYVSGTMGGGGTVDHDDDDEDQPPPPEDEDGRPIQLASPPPPGRGPPLIPPGLVKNAEKFVEKKQEQLVEFKTKFGRLDYSDQSLTGVIYTWQNFNADLGGRGVLSITGTLIAYGGNPAIGSPTGTSTQGQIDIEAMGVDLVYDPTYLRDLLANTGPVKVKRSLWATW